MIINVDGNEVDLLVGADPELFAKQNSKLISAYGLVPGTKDFPHKVKDGAIQVDGMALEFNIDPANSMQDFVNKINSVMRILSSSVPKGIELSIIPTANFGSEYISKQPQAARDLGCSPDYNAYTNAENPRPNVDAPFRTASGHVHIGWTQQQNIEDPEFLKLCCDLTKVLDVVLGIPSLIADTDTTRRSLYGKAGAFRPKSYGLEYRVLSNFWLQSEKYMEWVYSQVVRGVEDFLRGFRADNIATELVINNSDIVAAKDLISTYKLQVPYVY